MKTNINNALQNVALNTTALRYTTHNATQNLLKSSIEKTRERESKRREALNSKHLNAKLAQILKSRLLKSQLAKPQCTQILKSQHTQLAKSKQGKSTITLSVASVLCVSSLAIAQMPQDFDKNLTKNFANDFDKDLTKDFAQDLMKENLQNPQTKQENLKNQNLQTQQTTQENQPTQNLQNQQNQNPQNQRLAMLSTQTESSQTNSTQVDSTQTNSSQNQNLNNNAKNNNAYEKTYNTDSNQDYKDYEQLQAKDLGKVSASAVVSSGFDLPLKDEPKNVLKIPKENLTSKGYTSLEQALQYQPLITFTNNGFGSNIDLRGQGSEANRAVKILINRVPISLLDTSHGVPPYNNLDIEDIEAIEVLPGGGAVVYGNGTRGGVVNIITKTPSKDFARIVLKASSGERLGLQGGGLSLAGGKKINNALFVRGDVSASYVPNNRNVSGKNDSVSGNDEVKAFKNDNNTNIYGAIQTIWTPNENHKLDFSANYSHLWQSYPREYLENADTTTTTTGTSPNLVSTDTYNGKLYSTIKKERFSPHADTYKTQTDALQTALNYTAKFNDNLDFDALAFYQFSLLRYTKDNYTTPTFINLGSDGKAGFQNHGGGLNLKLKHKAGKYTFIVGLDNVLEHSKRTNYTNHRINVSAIQLDYHYTADIANEATKLSNSLYVFDNFRFAKWFDLSKGARIEYSNYWTTNNQMFNSTCSSTANNAMCASYGGVVVNELLDFKAHTQRLSYAAEITPNFRYSDTGNIYAKAELGFISPSAFQMINADPNSAINQGNPQGTQLNKNELNGIKPERYVTGEIGWRDYFSWSDLSATFFYTHTFDEIFVNTISHGTAYSYSNLGETQRAGAELMANQGFWNDRIKLGESVSYIYTNILQTNATNSHLKGKSVPYVPFIKATLHIQVEALKLGNQSLSVFFNNAYYGQSIDTTTRTVAGQSIKESYVMNKGGYVLSDLGLNYKISYFQIGAGVRNLFDSLYATYQKYPNYIAGLGRTYYIELRFGF
ncbi:TonB-dependent receptor [Helicobacter sp. T3_23-1059]